MIASDRRMWLCFAGASTHGVQVGNVSLHPSRFSATCGARLVRDVNGAATQRKSKCRVLMQVYEGEGFVNCGRCGADVVVDLRSFKASNDGTHKVRCDACGERWVARYGQAFVLQGSDIVRAADVPAAGGVFEDMVSGGMRSAASSSLSPAQKVTLWVGGLPSRIGDKELEQLFSSVVKVESVNVVRDRVTDRSRGFGFVEVDSSRSAQDAIDKFHGSNAFGGRMSVRFADGK
ncbi:RNA-binding protein CP33, chloroplastic [Porphyridium purpureum]|uniref:RNA-binding protein CP33, chloroplastic n=1 Tax=Porphyridium purpureum TaxID=35688 RepID=A0A5J4YP05_PORPP|nr:RNA-binding protein CP33, chloroplastic [Porphyridium purpureum]|eukprot:POR0501..scf296_7